MKRSFSLVVGVLFLFTSVLCRADDGTPKSKEEAEKIVKGLNMQHGEITLQGGLAKLNILQDFNYLDAADAGKVLVKLWGNPPSHHILGMILPANTSPLSEECWAVTISYQEDGYVKDNDAGKINYDKLLKQMQKAVSDANPERVKSGYKPIELVGWAAPPRYDPVTHKMYWAKELKFEGSAENTLNYNIRILGRRGVLVLNAIGGIEQLKDIEKVSPQILGMVNFNEGHRYSDFDPKVDKVATYGLAALVVGGVAAKAGLFKLIWVFILGAKKLIIVAFVAIASAFKKLFGGKKREG